MSKTKVTGATTNNYFYTCDANGNIAQMIDTADSSIKAHYVYSPFGEVIYQTGVESTNNVYRFSTKYHDDEVGLVYYGLRYYDAELGRWINRDPIGEMGGYSVYAYVLNNSMNMVDPLGLVGTPDCCCCCVEDMNIENIAKVTQLPLYGHSFDTVIKLKYIKDNTRNDCTLKWGEKTNRPVVPGAQPNQWYDAYALFPNSVTFNPWNNRTKPCLGSETTTITDKAMANVNLPARHLYFAITVESGDQCPCTRQSITVYATQLLEPDGTGGITKQELALGGVMM